MTGICPEALCLLVPSGLGEAQLEFLWGVVILDPAHLNAWPMAPGTLGWREPGLSQMWDCMGDSSSWLLWGGPTGGWGGLRSMLHGGGVCLGRNIEIFDWGFEGYVGVCQVEAGRWGAVGGFHSENGGWGGAPSGVFHSGQADW